MSSIVNALKRIRGDVADAGITLWADEECLYLTGPAGSATLRLVRMYRPSSDEIERQAAADVLLVLTAANSKVARQAARHNHLLLPDGGYRIVAPGIALLNAAPATPVNESRQVRLTGRTGVVAETLLLGGQTTWSVRELAAAAGVSPALAHRVVVRLEREGILRAHGRGAEKTRAVSDPQALADLWSREEKLPKPLLRGYLYGNSVEATARKVLEVCPTGAVGGVLAANLDRPVLTQVPLPIRIWVPSDFTPDVLATAGFEPTQAGANLELLQTRTDPWQVHRSTEGLSRVSAWRAWLEIAKIEGRTEELATALRSDLERHFDRE